MKKYIPNRIKLNLKVLLRFLNDLIKGYLTKFASKNPNTTDFQYKVDLTQDFKPTSSRNNKIINIKLASQKINEIVINPTEIFSFWKTIGKPSKRKGFTKGRNLIQGELKVDYGGGLCQLSGMIYYAALLSNLEILERHNHTVDLYTDEERFAPLGSDATVVYGYKDLRIRNNYSFPVRFKLTVNKDNLHVALLSPEKINEVEILFETEFNNNKIEVKTMKENKIIAKSIYKKKSC
ncbi:MAG: VanW family protein [Bacteroidales bacterium]|nr:VanW family protein [Bacteroidales bacterium]